MENYQLYDKIVSAMVANLFTFSKSSGTIILDKFDYENYNHLFIYEMAKIVQCYYNRMIYLDQSFKNHLIFKIKNRKDIFHRKKGAEKGINIEEILDFVQENFEQDSDIFKRIYLAYYDKKKG
jgi:hypothetical protein